MCFMTLEGESAAPVTATPVVKESDPEEKLEQRETFVAFARVYSGVVKKGQSVFVLGPKYDPTQGLSMVNADTHSMDGQYRQDQIIHICIYNTIKYNVTNHCSTRKLLYWKLKYFIS